MEKYHNSANMTTTITYFFILFFTIDKVLRLILKKFYPNITLPNIGVSRELFINYKHCLRISITSSFEHSLGFTIIAPSFIDKAATASKHLGSTL